MIDAAARYPALHIADKQILLRRSCRVLPGSLKPAIDRFASAAGRAARGLFRKDASTWSADPAVKSEVADRLGWLDSPALMAGAAGRLEAFAAAVAKDGITDVVLLGMGGSSLAPEVLRAILGTADKHPRFQMLDSTDPAAVRAVSTTVDRTLYVLASKSGGTIEPNSMAAHFRAQLEAAGVPRWANHFVAITDEGTSLDRHAHAERFREIFINPSDIGGRYSALSYFGLVPAALMGQDAGALAAWGIAMIGAAEETAAADTTATDVDAAVGLGLALGAGARSGRDKMTLLVPPHFEAFGLWVEQLIAESTGKHGVGVVPVAGEATGPIDLYGKDRLFVSLHVAGEAPPPSTAAFEAAGIPVVVLDLPEPMALGAEFVRWEIATAIAGALLEINPFDQPNVQQAKDATKVFLTEYEAKGRLPIPAPPAESADGVAYQLSKAARRPKGSDAEPVHGDELETLLSGIEDGDYLALLAYVPPGSAFDGVFDRVRALVRNRFKIATTAAYGPRYLHSTGQLHKGGPNTGVFVLISATPTEDVPIPGERFSFGTLEMAQALGDFASLDAAGRRALHIHLPRPDAQLLSTVLEEP